jgi:homoaconitase/3-isopropylmalate dehydratase large subunit
VHAVEKILARAAGREEVTTGEIVNCTVDLAGINDLYLQTLRSFAEMGGKKVHDPRKVVMFLDHFAPASTITQADNQKQFREFCWEQGIDLLMDIDQGVCHQILADKRLVRPGMLVVVTDSHTTTYGAFGAFGTGVGATDLAIILMTGQLWFRVPEVIQIHLEGTLGPGVYAKDVILKVIGTLGADYGVYPLQHDDGDGGEDRLHPARSCHLRLPARQGESGIPRGDHRSRLPLRRRAYL